VSRASEWWSFVAAVLITIVASVVAGALILYLVTYA